MHLPPCRRGKRGQSTPTPQSALMTVIMATATVWQVSGNYLSVFYLKYIEDDCEQNITPSAIPAESLPVCIPYHYCGTKKGSTNVITAYLCSDLSHSLRRLYTDQRINLHHRRRDSPGTFEEKYPLPSDSIPIPHSKKASFLAPRAMTDQSSEDVHQECHNAPGGICRLNCPTDW